MRILYMSGYADHAADRAGRLERGAAFMAKPFTPEALLSNVRQALRRAYPDAARMASTMK
jgi:DNA-binding response OmpR family regulator